jgi:tetratricopeptide (TPR) repeat protein
MRSCIAVFYIALLCLPAAVAAQNDPDALYRDRANIDQARAAATIWESRLKVDAHDFESAWKLARVCYWLGNHEPQEAMRRTALERGVEAGRQAVSSHGDRPEGHFWIAANMGTLAESFGLRQGLKYRGEIKSELETVLRIDPGFQKGSADRVLGRWYFKVPGLFGGSNKKSEEHLRKSLAYDNNSTVSHYFLAETLFDLKRDSEAIAELKQVIAVPMDPEWAAEDREYKEKATELLKKKQK